MQKLFIILGIIFLLIGIFFPLIKQLGLGQLPGDIVVKRDNFTFYFPLVTCLLISVVLSLIFWFLNR